MSYRIVKSEELNSASYVQHAEDVWQGGSDTFFLYRNTAFRVDAKADGGFVSQFDDDYSDDPALAAFNDTKHETATVPEAVQFWVNTIRLAGISAANSVIQ